MAQSVCEILGTVFPDGDKQPFGDNWEVNEIGK
jgi:hypothetical protein